MKFIEIILFIVLYWWELKKNVCNPIYISEIFNLSIIIKYCINLNFKPI